MNHFSLRLTYTEDCKYDEVVAYLHSKFKTFAICDELGKANEKPHCHCYVLSEKKVDTHRKQVSKLTTLAKGNTLFSFIKIKYKEHIEIVDGFNINYLAYMMKQKSFHFEGIPQRVEAAACAYQESVLEDLRLKKEKKETRYARIIRLFEEQEYDTEHKKKCIDCDTVINFVIEFFVLEKCVCSVSTVESWVNTLLMKYDICNYRSNLNGNICRRLFPK